MNKLDEIRQQLQNASQGNNNTQKGNSGAFYPFWNTPVDTTVHIRFLPDGDDTNVYFWRERQIIRIPFASVEGRPELENVIVEVPCVKMYGKSETCPIQAETRSWWKTEKEEYARRYWPKKTYLYQGFVRSSGFEEESAPENPIRRFIINKPIHQMIESSLLDPEMEHVPCDYDNGTDFKIFKKQGPQYADYSTSGFARKESPLSVQERESIDEHGLFDLSTFLPKKPNEEELQVIFDMFVESLKDGESEYKAEWGNFFRPKNVDLGAAPGQGTSLPKAAPKAAPAPKAEAPQQEAVKEPAPSSEASNTDDILNQLRSRINK